MNPEQKLLARAVLFDYGSSITLAGIANQHLGKSLAEHRQILSYRLALRSKLESLVGSFSSNYWGIPRSTKGAEFVIFLPRTDLQVLCEKLSGFRWIDDQMRFETIMGTQKLLTRHEACGFEVELFSID